MKFTLFIVFAIPTFAYLSTFRNSEFDEACSDFIMLSSHENLLWPSKSKPVPWQIFPSAKVYKSSCFDRKFQAFFSRNIPGRENITFNDFLQTLISRNCYYYPHGGFIRDLINSRFPHDLDGQYSCSQEELQTICDDFFGVGFGFVDMKISYFYIGNHSLEGFNWNDSFFKLTDQEYTPDTLYYDFLNSVILDLSGKGLEDTQKSQIRIPVERNQWDQWLIKESADDFRKMFALRKIPRYWKLKEIGFKDYDPSTSFYIKRSIANLWDNDKYSMKTAFLLHICWILDGVFKAGAKNWCAPQNGTGFMEVRIQKCKTFVQLFSLDFAQMPGRVLKDINEAIRGTGCFLVRNETRWIIFTFFLFFSFVILGF